MAERYCYTIELVGGPKCGKRDGWKTLPGLFWDIESWGIGRDVCRCYERREAFTPDDPVIDKPYQVVWHYDLVSTDVGPTGSFNNVRTL